MPTFPQPIHDAAAAFDGLPGVGPRAALRYAYWLVTQPKDMILRFAKQIEKLADTMISCSICHQWADSNPCSICQDSRRDTTSLCVVAHSQNIRVIEETGIFKGRYHVLNGTLDPIEGRTAETLNIPTLIKRLQQAEPPFQELLFAFDVDIPGDTTALFLHKQISSLNIPVRITRLARGLPTGASLEYADAYTLADALKNRK